MHSSVKCNPYDRTWRSTSHFFAFVCLYLRRESTSPHDIIAFLYTVKILMLYSSCVKHDVTWLAASINNSKTQFIACLPILCPGSFRMALAFLRALIRLSESEVRHLRCFVEKLEMFCRGHTFPLCNRMTCNYLYLSFLRVIIDICCMTLFEIPEHHEYIENHALTEYRPAARFHLERVRCLALHVSTVESDRIESRPVWFHTFKAGFQAKPLTGFDRQK